MIAQHDPTLDSIEPALRNNVCNHCTLSRTAGDYCSELLARTCPLSRYALDVVQLLERLPQETSNGISAKGESHVHDKTG
jgi:hypothetical protein